MTADGAAPGAGVQCDRQNGHEMSVTIRQLAVLGDSRDFSARIKQKWPEVDSSPQSTAEVENGVHSPRVQGQL